MGTKTQRRPSNKRANVTVLKSRDVHQPHRLSGTVAVSSRSRGAISATLYLSVGHQKRSGGLDNRKEIDQLNRDDLGARLEQIIFFVISVEVHWCHAVSVVFFFSFNLSPRLYQKRLAALSFY